MKNNNIDQEKIKKAVYDILEAIGEDPMREGLLQTPDRVARMLEELTAGYNDDAKTHLSKTFVESGSEVVIEKGVIAAKRHIHFNVEEAAEAGVVDKQIVSVKVGKEGERSVIFGDVVVRVSPKYAAAMHIDTDESNAAGCGREVYGEIVK